MFYGLNKFAKVFFKRLFYRALLIVAIPVIFAIDHNIYFDIFGLRPIKEWLF